MPKHFRWRKHQRGKIKGAATRGHTVSFGEYGVQALDPGWITANQLEAARVAATRVLGTQGRLYMRVFPQKSVSATAEETRMGTGKGEVAYWTAVIKPGAVLFEVAGVAEGTARTALNRLSHKLPIRVKLLKRRHGP